MICIPEDSSTLCRKIANSKCAFFIIFSGFHLSPFQFKKWGELGQRNFDPMLSTQKSKVGLKKLQNQFDKLQYKIIYCKMQKAQKAQTSEEQSYQFCLSWSNSPTDKQNITQTESKRLRSKPKKGKSKKNPFNSSLWTIGENTSYMLFLMKNRELFDLSKIQRRDIKINVLMSQFVKTRSADQCRSHHQKMIKYHSNINGIIQYVENMNQNGSTLQNQQQIGCQIGVNIEEQSFIQVEDLLINREESFCLKLMTDDDFF